MKTRDERASLVEARGLSLHAGARCLVQDLNWRCEPGQRWCVVGRNAVGKTTLLRALAGLPVAGRTGSVEWQAREQARWSAATAATARAFMAQQPQDRFSQPVRRLIDLSMVGDPTRVAPALSDVMSALDVAHLAGRDVMRLSGGERQRVALAQCAVQGAPLMLLDEPVAFQDPAHQLQVARWLVDMGQGASHGVRNDANNAPCASFVITAHDMNWIARVATHVLALQGDGAWSAGTAAAMLTPDVLEHVFGCRWRQVGDALLPEA